MSLIALLFTARDKKADARKQMYEALAKAKYEAKPKFEKSIAKIIQNFDELATTFETSIEEELSRLNKIKDYIDKIELDLKLEYSKLNITNYGHIN